MPSPIRQSFEYVQVSPYRHLSMMGSTFPAPKSNSAVLRRNVAKKRFLETLLRQATQKDPLNASASFAS